MVKVQCMFKIGVTKREKSVFNGNVSHHFMNVK